MRVIALIPARSGSKRVPDKNIRHLAGKPLITYTLAQIYDTNIFDQTCVSSDSENYLRLVSNYDKEIQTIKRPTNISEDITPDIKWVLHAIDNMKLLEEDIIVILRPTSPFRKPETIINGIQKFRENPNYDSLRAVTLVDKHPAKMWSIAKNTMLPIMPFETNNTPWHSHQTNTLPKVYEQTAALEITTVGQVKKNKSISGSIILPYITNGFETIDINSELDFSYCEYIMREKFWQ